VSYYEPQQGYYEPQQNTLPKKPLPFDNPHDLNVPPRWSTHEVRAEVRRELATIMPILQEVEDQHKDIIELIEDLQRQINDLREEL
jgi:hypothetical protein